MLTCFFEVKEEADKPPGHEFLPEEVKDVRNSTFIHCSVGIVQYSLMHRTEHRNTAAHRTEHRNTAAHRTEHRNTAEHRTEHRNTAAHRTEHRNTAAHRTEHRNTAAHRTEHRNTAATTGLSSSSFMGQAPYQTHIWD